MNMISEGLDNEFEERSSFKSSGYSDPDDHRADKKAHLGAGSLPDFSELAQDLDFSDFFCEEGIFGSSNIDETSFDAAINSLKKPQGRRVGKGLSQVSFTEEDFDDPAQRKAFILLRHYKNEIFKANAKTDEIIEAATFIFGRSITNELNFDLCCEVLNARRDVLRMRFHYEFFLKWMVFPVEFPFLIDPLPKVIENEILMYINEDARTLAVEAWAQPGISTAEMYSRAASSIIPSMYKGSNLQVQMKRWLEAMEDRHIMSRQHDNWYLTGRNPLLEKISAARFANSGTGVNVSWSKLW